MLDLLDLNCNLLLLVVVFIVCRKMEVKRLIKAVESSIDSTYE